MRILYAALLFMMMLVGAPAALAAPQISVGLVTGQFTAELASETDFTAQTVVNGSVRKEFLFKAGSYYFNAANGSVNADGQEFGNVVLRIKADGVNPVKVNKKTYRGNIEVMLAPDRKNLIVRNVLPVDEYLYSVVGRTVPVYFPDEAIKAQAVAMRSYALWFAENNNYYYDVRAGEKDYVYSGTDMEKRDINKLIDSTRGEVVLYGGRPAMALYTESSGGYTEDSADVYGEVFPKPYLKSVKDYDSDAPDYKWERSFDAQNISSGLLRGGYDIGQIESIRLSPEKPGASDRTDTGRVISVGFAGSKGNIVVPAAVVRELFSLPSTLFEIEVTRPIPKQLDVPIENYYGMEIGRKEIEIELKDKEKSENGIAGSIKLISGVDGEKVIFKGRGSGNGLGLSLWGARQLANDEGNTPGYYKNILRYYYRNTVVTKIY